MWLLKAVKLFSIFPSHPVRTLILNWQAEHWWLIFPATAQLFTFYRMSFSCMSLATARPGESGLRRDDLSHTCDGLKRQLRPWLFANIGIFESM